jgi:predicted Zn-dependent protease
MSPQEATALHVLAYVLLHNGQADKAAVLLEAVDALRPGDTRTVLALATAHLRGGAAARALQALDRFSRDAPAPPTANLLRAQALSLLDRPDEARTAMHAFLAPKPPLSTG